MKRFANARTLRNTIFMVLLGWLFALASGVANACLLDSPDAHSPLSNGSAAVEGQQPADLGGHLGANVGHHPESCKGNESCLKACDDGTRTLPSPYSGVGHIDPGPAPFIAIVWVGATAVIAASHRKVDSALPAAELRSCLLSIPNLSRNTDRRVAPFLRRCLDVQVAVTVP